MKKFSDELMSWLSEAGYTHCFYLAGGNIMHALESAHSNFVCVPFVHEVSAGIAAEYFNEANLNDRSKAFVLVTAGPGVTNLITSLAGAYLESRQLLVIAGQVKSENLREDSTRQRGIQEIDGMSLTSPFVKKSLQIRSPVERKVIEDLLNVSASNRPGPVYVEFCLDAQGAPSGSHGDTSFNTSSTEIVNSKIKENQNFNLLLTKLSTSKRPIILLGGGVSRKKANELSERLSVLNLPIMTTWNGADRYPSDAPNYFGRPNIWGQRYANVLLQQADFLIAIGTRVGLQQTGFNSKEFLPVGDLAIVDIDPAELNKTDISPKFRILGDADEFLELLLDNIQIKKLQTQTWMEFCHDVKRLLPLSEAENTRDINFINPYEFFLGLSQLIRHDDCIIPSSSGSTETVAMQSLLNLRGNQVITNKSLASMGYGLAGAIGAAIKTGQRVLHIEGDGGFAQNLQELGTVSQLGLPIKTFIFSNEGYASIRMTQRNYFKGNYIGCDVKTGLGLPEWESIFKAYGISCTELSPDNPFGDETISLLNDSSPRAFIVPIDPEQTYFPKISSRVQPGGSMESEPLHLMSPPLPIELSQIVFKYLKE